MGSTLFLSSTPPSNQQCAIRDRSCDGASTERAAAAQASPCARETPTKKPRRARKAKANGDSAKAKGKPNKTDVPKQKNAAGKPERRATGTTSVHFPGTGAPCRLALDAAVARRKDWTPPKDTEALGVVEPSPILVAQRVSRGGDQVEFTQMVSSFACSAQESSHSPRSRTKGEDTKRRRIELVDLPCNHAASDPVPVEDFKKLRNKEKKKKKKKARTITDLVTSKYRAGNRTPNPLASDAITSFGAPGRRTCAKPRSRTKTAVARRQQRDGADTILSPASALLRIEQQNVLFGTSSQLAREESPTSIRHLQAALHASEAVRNPAPNPLLGRRASSGLWSVGARYADDRAADISEALYKPGEGE